MSIDTKQIALSVEASLALYGSTDRWPTLQLNPNEFPFCTCGHERHGRHRIGSDSSPCGVKNCKCTQFTFADGKIRKRAS